MSCADASTCTVHVSYGATRALRVLYGGGYDTALRFSIEGDALGVSKLLNEIVYASANGAAASGISITKPVETEFKVKVSPADVDGCDAIEFLVKTQAQ